MCIRDSNTTYVSVDAVITRLTGVGGCGLDISDLDARIAGFARATPSGRAAKSVLPTDRVYDTDIASFYKNASIASGVITLTKEDDTTTTLTIPAAPDIDDLIKNVSLSGQVLTFTQQDDSVITITLPSSTGGLTQSQVDARIATYARATPSGRMAKAQLPSDAVYDDDLDDLIKNASLSGQVLTLTQNDDSAITITLPSGDLAQSFSWARSEVIFEHPETGGATSATSVNMDISPHSGRAGGRRIGTEFMTRDTTNNYFTMNAGFYLVSFYADLVNATSPTLIQVTVQRQQRGAGAWRTLTGLQYRHLIIRNGGSGSVPFLYQSNSNLDRLRLVCTYTGGSASSKLTAGWDVTRLTLG